MGRGSKSKTNGAMGLGPGGGEMGERIRSFDWSQTPLGPTNTWEQSLKTSVNLMLNSRYPMFVWWGPQLIKIYNDSYIPILGKRHPDALGRPAPEIWKEIWPVLGPQAELVTNEGQATWNEELLLLMERYGFTEETYFTFSYSPIANDQGQISGVFCACTEETAKVVGRRRLKLLRDLGERTLEETRSLDHAVHAAAETLTDNPFDLPFALVYLADGQTAKLTERIRVHADSPAAPPVVLLGKEDDLWKFARAAKNGRQTVKLSRTKFGTLAAGAWEDDTAKNAVVLPLLGSSESPAGFLVCGLSPRLSFDDEYAGFIDLIAGQISTAISNAISFQEEKARAEALAELDRAKTEFFSNVSHEFRTPLTLTLGNIEELAQSGELPERQRERLDSAHRNSLRLLKLVNTLLDFSRIEAGRAQKHFEPVDLAALTADLAGSFRSAVESAGLRLIVETPKPSIAMADREMWEKIVLNLISNAYKFTFDGEIRVSVRQKKGSVVLDVRDTGVGIPEDQLDKVFERFHRVRSTVGRTHEGTGIGLSLVRELVELHGGRISVKSKPGRGTTFTVEIPKHTAANAVKNKNGRRNGETPTTSELNGHSFAAAFLSEMTQPSDVDARAESDGEVGRVLLVDDNADMRAYISRLLAGAGFTVDLAADGVEAVEAARSNPPELILSDIMMPRMNGFELLRVVRGDERLREVPFIMLSARAGEESKVEGLDAGADDYLIKPFSANELLSRVRSHLKLKRQRSEIEQQLRDSAERYKAFIENSSEGIWRFELDEPIPVDLPVEGQIDLAFERGYLGECNDAYARQYGFENASEITGARLSDVLVADDPKNREFLHAFIVSGYRLTDAESHERDRDGNDRYFLNNFVGVVENGRLVRAWGTQRDVTGTREAEKSTALLAGIVSSSDDAIVSHDLNGRINSWNRGAEKIFGYGRDEVIGKHISILAIDGDRRDSDEIIARTRRGERVEHYETVQLRKDGSLAPVALSASPIVDHMGNVVGVSKIARDISEQKRAQSILDRYRLLSMQARDIILFIEPATGRIVEANQAAVNTYGYDHDALLTMSIRDLRAPETLDRFAEHYKKADESGNQFETVHVRRDGSRIPVEVNAVGADIGNERFLISIIRDISERKAAEEAFLQNQAILALAMESSGMGAWTRDLKSNYVWSSEELESIFGLPPGTFAQSENAFYELIHEEDRELLFSEVERAIAEHRSYTAEFRFYYADGSVRWMEGRGQAVYTESGEPVRIYGVGIDITERKKLQESVLENEERFRGLMEQAPFSIQLFDATGRTIRVNRSWEILWGLPAEQMGDYNVLEDPQLEAKGIAPYIRRAFAGEAVEVPAILYDPNETLPGRTSNLEPKRWVSAVAYPLKAADGTVKEVVLVHQDITARRNAEESVRQTLGQLALITNIAPVYISHYDRDECLKFANRAFTERYDLRPEDCIGKHISTIIGKEAYSEVREHIEQVLKGEAVEFDAEVPYPIIGTRYVHASYAPEFDENGNVAGYVAAVTDITEHRRAEEEIRRVNERFQIAERASRGFIYDWNLRTDAVARTEGFNRVLGYAPGEIADTGEAMIALVHPKDIENNNIREMLALGAEHITTEYRVLHKNGSWVWFRDEAAVILDARGGAVRMIGSTVDITARKLAENRLVLLAHVSELIRTVGDPAELMYQVSWVTGEHLEVSRCLFNEIDLKTDLETVHKDYCNGVPSVTGINRISDYSSLTLQEMMEGRTVVNNDAEADPRTSDIYEQTYKPNSERAYVAVPLLREGKWVASLWASDDEPRQWRGAEIKLLETIAERTWTAVEKLRLDIERRESEERFTKAFNSSPLALTISSLKTGELIAVNDTFVQISGYSREEAVGRTTVELGLWARVDEREEEMEQVRRTGQVRNVEYEFVVRDGSVVVGLLSAERVEIGGEAYALTVIQDITERKRAEEAIREKESTLRAYYNSSPLMMGIVELAGDDTITHIYDNPATCRFFGVDSGETAGRPADDLGSTRTGREIWTKYYRESQALSEPVSFEYEDEFGGQKRWLSVTVSPIGTAENGRTRFAYVAEDTTERKMAEERIRYQLNLTQTITDNTQSCLWLMDAEGRTTFANHATERISGYRPEELVGKVLHDLVHHSRPDGTPIPIEECPLGDTSKLRVPVVAHEDFFIHKDGHFYPVRCNARPIVENGEFKGTVLEVQDITEEKRAQEALLRAERKAADEYLRLLERIIPLAEALGTAPDMTTIYRSLGSFINASMEISAFFVSFYEAEGGLRVPAYVWGEGEEIDISELPPMPITAGGGPNSQAIFERRAVITNSYWEQQKDRPHVVVHDNGMDPHSSLVVPMMLQNKVLGTLEVQAHANGAFNNEHAVALEMAANLAAVSIENLHLIETEAHARAEAETANRMKDEFLSVLSHELRTPLNAMLGWIRIMRGGSLDEQRAAKALEIIERNTRQQSSLIEDLLDVSRIISGKMRIEKELIDLTPTLNAVADTIRPLAASKDLIFLVEGDDEPLYVRGDAVRLQQVVTNLLQNAVKFTPAGGVVTFSQRRNGLTAELTVSDTGVGISKDFLPHIFDRFSQADLSTKRSNTGLGLGLTIVSNIVELHGGHITADSDGPGTGATFKVQLPLEPDLYQQIELPAKHLVAPAGSIEGLRILVVDDDLESTIPLKILIEREGAAVVCVDNAGEALEQLRENDFDLLISDIGMPMMDGYELITNLRLRTDSPNSSVRAIAFTAYASEDDRRKLEEAGFDAHVAKPLDFDELLRVVAKLAKNRRI